MNSVLTVITLISGLYFIILSFALNTSNFASALIFKVIPFFCGVGCIFVSAVLSNIIKINF